MKPIMNRGWFRKESVNDIIAVLGSKTHRYPAKKVKIIDTKRTTGKRVESGLSTSPAATANNLLLHRNVEGARSAITSVRRRSKAFKSGKKGEKSEIVWILESR